ncbi:Adenylate cyclase 1 [Hartmannibacter diazotrophicus]|uniref:Adenylate cyclase 1 n=1 Tax=Hartmannibacter diazotrophicus TaxID=1482074 RepID=A0A2C9D615_9HYPH|nr:adenylate/guanylate cyclase domain-containing protein [Hartmannibacter diazotrophicus]SON55764.1 Adenylate cyclase 1 [Hartmannibacter diazotrophicus]
MARPQAWTDEDDEVLASIDLAAGKRAAIIRVIVALVFFVAMVVFTVCGLSTRHSVFAVAVLNFLFSLAVLRVVYAGQKARWVPWLIATADAVFLFGIGFLGPWFEHLPAGYRAALVPSWAIFLFLAMTALRAHGGIVFYQTVLFVVSFAVFLWWPNDDIPMPASASNFSHLFSTGANATRVLIVFLTGVILAAGAYSARRSTMNAIRTARERSTLQRFVPTELEHVVSTADLADFPHGRRQRVVALFADLRNFTTLSETLDPGQTANLLNSFRMRAERVISAHGGIIDKFVGDGILVVFGAGEPRSDDAERAVKAAIALVAEVESWNRKRVREGRQSVGIGIGAHIGEVFVGVLGGERRLEFTVIGDAVNVAERLEEMTRKVEMDLVLSGDLLDASGCLTDRSRTWRALDDLHLRGRAMPVPAYALERERSKAFEPVG